MVFGVKLNLMKFPFPFSTKSAIIGESGADERSTPYLEAAHLWDKLNQLRLVPQVCKHQRKEDVVMIFLEILSRIVSILVSVVTVAKECKSYIQRNTGRKVNDPSVSLPASDGSKDDCLDNR